MLAPFHFVLLDFKTNKAPKRQTVRTALSQLNLLYAARCQISLRPFVAVHCDTALSQQTQIWIELTWNSLLSSHNKMVNKQFGKCFTPNVHMVFHDYVNTAEQIQSFQSVVVFRAVMAKPQKLFFSLLVCPEASAWGQQLKERTSVVRRVPENILCFSLKQRELCRSSRIFIRRPKKVNEDRIHRIWWIWCESQWIQITVWATRLMLLWHFHKSLKY